MTVLSLLWRGYERGQDMSDLVSRKYLLECIEEGWVLILNGTKICISILFGA